jgi:hypothetical protein
MSGFDHDVYAKEEDAMNDAELKGLFQPIKAWYKSEEAEPLRAEHGAFPLFWQDLAKWSSWVYVKKLYLTICDIRESGDAGTINVATLMGKKAESEAGSHVTKEEGVNDNNECEKNSDGDKTGSELGEGTKKRRKKSRWGDKSETTNISSSSTTTTTKEIMSSGDVITVNDGEPNTINATMSNMSGSVEHNDIDSATHYISNNNTSNSRGRPRTRKSTRWSDIDALTKKFSDIISKQNFTNVTLSAAESQQILILQMQLSAVGPKLDRVDEDYKALLADPSRPRSPSPPPTYDKEGKRTNRRDVRMREKLQQEQQRLLDDILKIDPSYVPPSTVTREKKMKKIYIPVDEFPDYNFIGLIIGPRGKTQKHMESETNTKISIRGKGSVKDGGKGYRGPTQNDKNQEEPLHVVITGEDIINVDRACDMIQDLLKPLSDEQNPHKMAQLRELAVIQGTLREELEFCSICGEKGHRQYECPHRTRTYEMSGVKCTFCGATSHPTRDCPIKRKQDSSNGTGTDVNTSDPNHIKQLDNEYNDFMDELTGGYIKEIGESGSGNGTVDNDSNHTKKNNDNNDISDGIDEMHSTSMNRKQQVYHVTSILTGDDDDNNYNGRTDVSISPRHGTNVTTMQPPPPPGPPPADSAPSPPPLNGTTAVAETTGIVSNVPAIETLGGNYELQQQAAWYAYYQQNPQAYYAAQKAQFEQMYPGYDYDEYVKQAQAQAQGQGQG